MTVIRQQRQKSFDKPCYIYYNDWTGEILSVGHSVRTDCPAPHFLCDHPDTIDIIAGIKSDKSYIINVPINNQPQLVKKTNYLQVAQRENKLYLLPETPLQQWDVRAIIYKANSMLVIEINTAMVSRLVAEHMRREITANADVVFTFYIIRKNMPDCLIQTIDINVNSLIKYGRVAVDITELNAFAGLTDIAIMTCRHYEHYYLELCDDKYVDNSVGTDSTVNHKKWQVVETDIEAHVEFNQTGEYVEITSIVDTDQLAATKLHQRMVKFYIVGDTPDRYHAELSVDINRLRMGKPTKFKIDFDIMDMNIIYQNHLLKVNKRTTYDTDPD